jgi:hypothetical protein
MFKVICFIVLVILFVYIIYENHRLKKGYINKLNHVASVFMEDVLSRSEEAVETDKPLVKYRKYREAHASLNSISAIVGGFEKLEELVNVDIALFDKNLLEDANTNLRKL